MDSRNESGEKDGFATRSIGRNRLVTTSHRRAVNLVPRVRINSRFPNRHFARAERQNVAGRRPQLLGVSDYSPLISSFQPNRENIDTYMNKNNEENALPSSSSEVTGHGAQAPITGTSSHQILEEPNSTTELATELQLKEQFLAQCGLISIRALNSLISRGLIKKNYNNQEIDNEESDDEGTNNEESSNDESGYGESSNIESDNED